MKGLLLSVLAASLAGCASVMPEPADTTPQNPTAVIASESTLGGAMLPNVKGKSVQYARADRRRTANDFQFDNWLLRNTVGRFLSGNDEILRLDRNLHWELDQKEKTYTECPLKGCPLPATPTQPEKPTTPSQPRPEKPEESSCKLTVQKNTFKGNSLSDKRSIASADAQLYRLVWFVELKDPAGKKATNTVTFDFWNAELKGGMKDALAMQNNFEQNYAKAMLAGTDIRNLINKDVYMALAGLGNSLGPKAENWAVSLGKEVQKMKGYPLAMKVEWTATDETCGASNKPAASPSLSSNPLDWVTGKASQATAPTGPLVQFTYEVKKMAVQPERDSVFEVPAKFKRTN
ncbi:hypothetical protein HPT27_15640 [Permianibacter sp. IMCC34836]|uniref:hypothetical protein n=1 Tax=Permianibacter fluminis TaxID=2738515 RepID=UPI001552D366|nr:hypothetical protein [Permianibacter fluminis]NQD38454.1 hypothetical protein [Permianibacter fluminis]